LGFIGLTDPGALAGNRVLGGVALVGRCLPLRVGALDGAPHRRRRCLPLLLPLALLLFIAEDNSTTLDFFAMLSIGLLPKIAHRYLKELPCITCCVMHGYYAQDNLRTPGCSGTFRKTTNSRV